MQSGQGNTCIIDLAFWDFNNVPIIPIMFYSGSYVARCQGRSASGEKYAQFFGSEIVPAIEVSEGPVQAEMVTFLNGVELSISSMKSG